MTRAAAAVVLLIVATVVVLLGLDGLFDLGRAFVAQPNDGDVMVGSVLIVAAVLIGAAWVVGCAAFVRGFVLGFRREVHRFYDDD